ncbi:protein phosphatase 1 regulatory subunit 37 isoform X2 [Oryzias melastigma]|uniref:protein phosphatase 1 regulatory subunit 37 isoform X2 n=1 Tax=Oryzias melastigma TaxID=30732 RepID=UPI00168D21E8|nr:protein phosphatase 1 regulatory subunit 37 isoform X2 [Oryzias melastigma]
MTRCSEQDEHADEANKLQKRRSKSGKHVSFPPDEQIVSSFVEDRDRASEHCVTMEEVLEAYQQSCSKHQVQPKERILQQLQQGGCVGGSVERLDLKGERLDHRSCEALEAVLKSLHFDFINLQAAQLEENGASSLLDMILYYESTTYLDVSDNTSMGTSAWRALAHLIKQSVRLSRLDVCNVSLVDYPARSLSKALLTSRLSVLHLHNAQLSGTPLFTLGLEELCDGLSRQTEGLKVLQLRNNHLTESGMEHLAKVLPGLKVLQVLDLGENSLGNEGIQVIREPLIANNKLKELGLARTSITCEGAVALAEFIAESRHIHKLDLRQNQVRLGGLMALSLSLRINRSLAFLDVDPVPPEEQDEFLVEMQMKLQGEITQRCLANASRLGLPTETNSET